MEVAHKPAAVLIKVKVEAQLCQHVLSSSSFSKDTRACHSIKSFSFTCYQSLKI